VQLGLKRDPKLLYFIRDGDVWASPKKVPGKKAGKPKRVATTGVVMEAGYIYFLDGDGDLARSERAMPGGRSAPPAATAAPAPSAVAKPAAKPAAVPPVATGPNGATEAAAWIAGLSLKPGKARWNVRIALDVSDEPATDVYSSATATRFHVDVYRDEWGFMFVHGGKTSHVRRTDTTFVNGSDAYDLLGRTPALADILAFVRAIETEHGVAFRRDKALVRSMLKGAKAAVVAWLTRP
jgi:hypothetical protein